MPKMSAAMIAERVYDHAVKNYEKGGWDVIVECWTVEDIVDHMDKYGITTLKGAMSSFGATADVWADRQADARNSAF